MGKEIKGWKNEKMKNIAEFHDGDTVQSRTEPVPAMTIRQPIAEFSLVFTSFEISTHAHLSVTSKQIKCQIWDCNIPTNLEKLMFINRSLIWDQSHSNSSMVKEWKQFKDGMSFSNYHKHDFLCMLD